MCGAKGKQKKYCDDVYDHAGIHIFLGEYVGWSGTLCQWLDMKLAVAENEHQKKIKGLRETLKAKEETLNTKNDLIENLKIQVKTLTKNEVKQ